MQEFSIEVDKADAGMRLDLYLLKFAREHKLGLSRMYIQKLIASGAVSAAGSAKFKPHYKIKASDMFKICLQHKETNAIEPQDIELDIVYEDEFLALINKPTGMVVHPGVGNRQHTLVNALLHHFNELSKINPDRPGIVHRLDKETSGLLLIAKRDRTHLALAKQFARHSIKRKYVAVVKGIMEFNEDIIEVPISRHPGQIRKMSVSFNQKAKYAKTYYRTLKRKDKISLVELVPFTGRTHQLRVHLNFLGHPILGDTKYGTDNKFWRLALHAVYLGFLHPDKDKFMEFSLPVPQEFFKLFS
jgi:23S rRNA pseudouridine1911/1915/1917 synthase